MGIMYNEDRVVGSTIIGAGGQAVPATGYGSLLVSNDATMVFSDPFDGGTVETTNTWTTQVSTGTVTQASGQLSIDASTTTLARAGIYSKASFPPSSVSPQIAAFAIQLEYPLKANVRRFWGMATLPGTPTVAVPITDGFGFELTEAGVFRGVVYASGVLVQSVALTAPADGNFHGYGILYRGDSLFFYVDTITVPVGAIPFPAPNVTVLPLCIAAVNAATPPTAGQVFKVLVATLGDYGKNTNQIADGSFPWRKATVKAASTAAAATDSPLVTTLHPSSVDAGGGDPTAFWSYAAASGGIANTTTAVTIKTAAGASVRNYLKTLTLAHDTLGAVTEIAIRDGAAGTVLWRGKLQTAAVDAAQAASLEFSPPLKGTANTLMEVVTLTAVTGGVFVNATGYTGA